MNEVKAEFFKNNSDCFDSLLISKIDLAVHLADF